MKIIVFVFVVAALLFKRQMRLILLRWENINKKISKKMNEKRKEKVYKVFLYFYPCLFGDITQLWCIII